MYEIYIYTFSSIVRSFRAVSQHSNYESYVTREASLAIEFYVLYFFKCC